MSADPPTEPRTGTPNRTRPYRSTAWRSWSSSGNPDPSAQIDRCEPGIATTWLTSNNATDNVLVTSSTTITVGSTNTFNSLLIVGTGIAINSTVAGGTTRTCRK